MLRKVLSLTLLLSLISSSSVSADAVYVTNDMHDPELSDFNYKKEVYLYWPEAPFAGVFMPTDDFKEISGCLSTCRDLEIEGLDSLPRTALVDPGPHFSPEALYFIVGLFAGGLIGYHLGNK